MNSFAIMTRFALFSTLSFLLFCLRSDLPAYNISIYCNWISQCWLLFNCELCKRIIFISFTWLTLFQIAQSPTHDPYNLPAAAESSTGLNRLNTPTIHPPSPFTQVSCTTNQQCLELWVKCSCIAVLCHVITVSISLIGYV